MSSVRHRLVLLAVILGLTTGPPGRTTAQPAPDSLTASAMERRLAESVDRLEASPESVRVRLRPVFEQAPGYRSDTLGSVARWLGMAHVRRGDTTRALRVWREGLDHLPDSTGGVLLADRYLRLRLPRADTTDLGAATAAAQRLFGQLGRNRSPHEQRVLRRWVAQSALVMPDAAVRRLLAKGTVQTPSSWEFADTAGDHLLRWWRSQDPVPRTPANERLQEHLRRVGHALATYPDEDRVTGFDDRGRVFVQYGPPSRQHELIYNTAAFQKEVFRFGVPVSQNDFPRNEVWTYHHIDESGYFIFVEEEMGNYQLGRARDLLPIRLRQASGNTDRQLNIAMSSLAALRYIYRELARLQDDFGPYYAAVDDYLMWQEEKAMLRSMGAREGREGRQARVGAGQTGRTVAWSPEMGVARPTTELQSTLDEAALAEKRAENRRETEMPTQHTSLLEDAESLPVDVRTTRFLTEDGRTRMEIDWALSPRVLAEGNEHDESAAQYRIDLTGVSYDRDYRRMQMARKTYPMDGLKTASSETKPPPRSHTVAADTGLYHLRLQWEQHWASGDGKEGTSGSRLRVATRDLDSLEALTASSDVLEMSDLRPLSVRGADEEVPTPEAARPYPFRTVRADTPLLLYFEVYHLAQDDQGLAQYEIDYEVERRTERSGLLGLLGGDKTEKTTTAMTQTGERTRTEEFILLEWGRDVEESTEVTVTVRVQDQQSGQQVERQMQMTLLPPSAE